MRFFFTGPRLFGGIRPGISFGPSDFKRFSRPSGAASNTSYMTGGFIYVLRDESGRHKIGSSRDPIERRFKLQTGCAEQLSFAYIGVASAGYADIERAAHRLLEHQKIASGGDEWFAVPSSIAIGAVIE